MLLFELCVAAAALTAAVTAAVAVVVAALVAAVVIGVAPVWAARLGCTTAAMMVARS